MLGSQIVSGRGGFCRDAEGGCSEARPKAQQRDCPGQPDQGSGEEELPWEWTGAADPRSHSFQVGSDSEDWRDNTQGSLQQYGRTVSYLVEVIIQQGARVRANTSSLYFTGLQSIRNPQSLTDTLS